MLMRRSVGIAKLVSWAASFLGLSMAFIALMIVAVMTVRSFALQYLWGLFIAPIFGIAEITLVQAAGLMIIMTVVGADLRNKNKLSPEDNRREALNDFTIPVVWSGIGYLIHTYGPGFEQWLTALI